jgi:hypothetical protein
MKSLLKAAVVAAALAVPAVSFAQQQQPVTRAQLRAEVVELHAAGYEPADWMHYPENIQAAEAKVQAQKAAQGNGTPQSGQ